MAESSSSDLEILRGRLTETQRGFLDRLWEYYRDQNEWVPCRLAHQQFGKVEVERLLLGLGDSIVRECEEEGEDCYRLTFLGVLLTTQGEESEGLLVRYLEYVRDRSRTDPRTEWVGSQEVEAALHLTAERSRLLRQLIRLSHWWGGGSAFAEREWTVGVPIDVEDLVAERDLRRYVRAHVLTHFPPDVLLAGTAGGRAPRRARAEAGPHNAFWFIRDPALRQRLAADWHEEQDVCQVRGWKSCVVLCGGILEAVLAEVLRAPEALPRAERRAGRGRHSLADLVAAAVARGILGPETVRPGQALEAFAALIHPGRAGRQRLGVTREDADAALEAVRALLRYLPTRAQGGAH
jgi:hypothetical protein